MFVQTHADSCAALPTLLPLPHAGSHSQRRKEHDAHDSPSFISFVIPCSIALFSFLFLQPHTGQMIPLSSTPGGSLYGTTPGGTRISYDRNSLMNFRNSPLSKSPAMLPQSLIKSGQTDITLHRRAGQHASGQLTPDVTCSLTSCLPSTALRRLCFLSLLVLVISLGVTTESAQPIPEEKLKAPAASSSTAAGADGEQDDEELFEME